MKLLGVIKEMFTDPLLICVYHLFGGISFLMCALEVGGAVYGEKSAFIMAMIWGMVSLGYILTNHLVEL